MPVTVYGLAPPDRLKGDAARACDNWCGDTQPLDGFGPRTGRIVVDALFGAGLDRPVSGAAAAAIDAVNASDVEVFAADLPSGLSGLTGRILGTAFEADHTVTFAAPKPGHYLLPGRALCGELEIVDIGIPRRFIDSHVEDLWLNEPALWQSRLPRTGMESHKYARGHLGVFSGGMSHTGAARLAARSGLRIGAGLVTILSPSPALAENAAHLAAIMLRPVDSDADLGNLLADARMNVYVLGPGFGVGEKAMQYAGAILRAGRSLVLDADGLTSFAREPGALFGRPESQAAPMVITPHEGEFARLFPDIAADRSLSKVEKARQAASKARATVIYKGADTVIAGPDGRAAICDNAPAWLATAGSGDCLAGFVGGLAARGMPPFEAACAAAWLHGEAGRIAGEGLIAEDLPESIPSLEHLELCP